MRYLLTLMFLTALSASAQLISQDSLYHLNHATKEMLAEGYVDKAAPKIKVAAENGHPEAMWNLGVLYNLGIGFTRDEQKAHEWFMRSAQAGNSIALEHVEHLMQFPDFNLKKIDPAKFKWVKFCAEEKPHACGYETFITSAPEIEDELYVETSKKYYIKTELLTTLYQLNTFENSLYFDISIQVRLGDGIFLVNELGWNKYVAKERLDSDTQPDLMMNNERIGTIFPVNKTLIRYHPFYTNTSGARNLFIEGGIKLKYQAETTQSVISNFDGSNITNDYTHELELLSTGIAINVGLSMLDYWTKEGRNFIVSPELYIGITYQDVQVFKDNYTDKIGNHTDYFTPTPFSTNDVGMSVGIKLGIGFK